MINQNLLLTGDDGYNLTNSLRFRSSASAYLSRTPATTTNRRTWTWSAWIKRGAISTASDVRLFSADNGVQQTLIRFQTSNTLQFQIYNSGIVAQIITTQVFRDPAAWYHIVAVMNTTDATSSNRMILYVNGVQVTALSTASYPTQNYDAFVNQTILHSTSSAGSSEYWDGYLAEVNFIDGQALTPSSFGETSASTGVWIPKKYTGTYGTNGFYLPFTDNSALTTSSNVGLGKDFSGNANYWTTNNISITSGSTYDSMTDVPTLTSATAGNYCTLNPLRSYSANTISNANLNVLFTDATSSRTTFSTFGVTSGKWYFEMTVTATGGGYYPGLGVNTDLSFAPSGQSGDTASGYMYLSTGQKLSAGLATYGSSYTTNDVIGVALDMDAGTITFYKNNTSQGQAFSGITGTAVPCFIGNANSSCAVNFGQQPFAYTPPSGFVALNTFNLTTPTIGATASTTANKYFNAVVYAGNSPSSQTITVGFQPDFVWQKSIGQVYNHTLYDAVRGATKELYSNTTDAETTDSNGLTAFTSNGFTIGSDGELNDPTANHVAWNWRASNTTAVTNTAGSITSTVSANTSAGFSIVTFTSQASGSSTIGHGLGVAPRMVIWKSRTDSTAWVVYHADLGADKYLNLNNTNASVTAVNVWNNTAPTSTVFSTGSDLANYGNIVAYCFAQVAGYSAFGSYTGNGSTDGTFVYTGFRPKFILRKWTDGSNQWVIFDTSRDTHNVASKALYPNLANAEETIYNLTDILSNGFKMRTTDNSVNGSGGNYIYMAFAENPFKYANAR
jgi:hypothetical protein